MNFDTDILGILLLSAGCIAALTGILVGLRQVMAVLKATNDPTADTPAGGLKASVVAFAPEEDDIERLAQSVAAQDYPDKELIIVIEDTAEHAKMLSEKFSRFENLYITFIQPGSHNLSKRKLAQTVGIKAAHGDVVAITSPSCLIPSEQWLSRVMAPFESEYTDIVLGYSHLKYERSGHAYRRLDALLTSCAWIAAAETGKPYRGDGNNLAFRRQLFFDQKGYSATNHLHYGDDDIFISQIATEANTKVVLSPDSILLAEAHNPAQAADAIKERYDVTRRWLPKGPFLRLGWLSCSQWLTMCLLIAGTLLTLPTIYLPILAGVALLGYWTAESLICRLAMRRLNNEKILLSVPFCLLWHPIGNLLFRLRHRTSRHRLFTYRC